MSKARMEREATARLARLLEVGDHAAARREARRILADPATPEDARREAAAVLASLEPEGVAVAVGLGALLLGAALAGWLVSR